MTTAIDKQNLFPRRILHTMLRVKDLKSFEYFYCQFLGMKVQRKNDYPERIHFIFFGL